MADLVKVGAKTPQAVIYKSESHKLHQSFVVKKGQTVVKGQPVKLNTDDGTISPYTGAEGEVYLGIAVNYSKYPCYPPHEAGAAEVTVMVEAFAVIHGIAKEAVTTVGFVSTDGTLDDTGTYPNFKPATPSTETKFIAINTAEIGELVRILVR